MEIHLVGGVILLEWNPDTYLQFTEQRTQPAVDLANRVRHLHPRRIVDLGCGPGNSTRVLRTVFANADLVGIDHSEKMICRAKEEHPDLTFAVGDAANIEGTYDLIFSNACLQWLPHHEELLLRLLSHLTENGALAVQMPRNTEEPLYRLIQEVADEPRWGLDTSGLETNETLSPDAYIRILSPYSRRLELWETVYYHFLPSPEHLLEWVRGTRLRPYLQALGETHQRAFEQEILRRATDAYPLTENGEVVFPFRRLFFIAYA